MPSDTWQNYKSLAVILGNLFFSPLVGIFWILFNWMELSTIESTDNSFGMPYTRHVCDFCTHVPIVSFKKKKICRTRLGQRKDTYYCYYYYFLNTYIVIFYLLFWILLLVCILISNHHLLVVNSFYYLLN